jgi:prepilin-type N-terminal cleavage/methylation domain-containing protein
MTKKEKNSEGFTLLELLIVITIISILSVAIQFVLNPSETMAKSRDVRRMADLTTLKIALGVYLTATSSPLLDNVANNLCLGGATPDIWYSADQTTAGSITDSTYPAGFSAFVQRASAAASAAVDGTGWVPVKLSGLVGGAAISNMPTDPINQIAINGSALGAITNNALSYRYVCRKSPLNFEIDAKLESKAYGTAGTDDKGAKDGGNNANLYEVGTDLTILPSEVGNNF